MIPYPDGTHSGFLLTLADWGPRSRQVHCLGSQIIGVCSQYRLCQGAGTGTSTGQVASPGTHLQGHLVLLVMQVGCWVVIVGGGCWCWVPGPRSLGLLETHEQLEGRLGHGVWHIVADISLGWVRRPSLRALGVHVVCGGGQGGDRWERPG